MADHLLEVRNLSVEFQTAAGVVQAVRDISYHLDRGETLAILGESGSGKSVSSSAIMNLIDMPPGRIASGEVLLDGVDLFKLPPHERRLNMLQLLRWHWRWRLPRQRRFNRRKGNLRRNI